MEGFDPNVAINMPEEQGFWNKAFGALGGVGRGLQERPEMSAIALDMLGKGFDPKNPFAGIGTALGKSGLASKAETAGQKHSMGMLQRIIGSMTGSKEKGLSSAMFSLGDDGKLDYKLSGREDGIETPTRMPGVETPQLGTPEEFEKRFGDPARFENMGGF